MLHGPVVTTTTTINNVKERVYIMLDIIRLLTIKLGF